MVPNATVVTGLLVVNGASVVIMILLRCDLVRAALIAGEVFALVAAAASSPGWTVANLVLAVLLAALTLAH